MLINTACCPVIIKLMSLYKVFLPEAIGQWVTLLKLKDGIPVFPVSAYIPSPCVACCFSPTHKLVSQQTLGHSLYFHQGSRILLATNQPKGYGRYLLQSARGNVRTQWISPPAMFYLIESLTSNWYIIIITARARNKSSNYVNEWVGLLTPVTSGLPVRKLVLFFLFFNEMLLFFKS